MINSMAGRDTTGEMLLVTAPRFYLVGLFTGGYVLNELHPRLCSIAPMELSLHVVHSNFPIARCSGYSSSLNELGFVPEGTGVRRRKNCSSLPKELEFVAGRTETCFPWFSKTMGNDYNVSRRYSQLVKRGTSLTRSKGRPSIWAITRRLIMPCPTANSVCPSKWLRT